MYLIKNPFIINYWWLRLDFLTIYDVEAYLAVASCSQHLERDRA